MEFFITAMGTRRVQTQFNRMGAAAIDAKPAFRSMLILIYEIEMKIFESQGRRGGGSWPRDSPAWLARKVRERLDPRIGYATHALVRSVTEPGDPGQVAVIRRNFLRFGSRLPYAAAQQRNRPFIKWTFQDRADLKTVLRSHLIRAWRSA